ncbi:MAG TPA: hypothetical protein VFN42_14060 [Acetobacteraceae bacterium]|nr:hypothetical protein [Acetobacteraceae bacterium]
MLCQAWPSAVTEYTGTAGAGAAASPNATALGSRQRIEEDCRSRMRGLTLRHGAFCYVSGPIFILRAYAPRIAAAMRFDRSLHACLFWQANENTDA